MRGFADNVGRKTEGIMVYLSFDKINEDKRRIQKKGKCKKFFGIVDGERCVFLETDKVEGEELKERDKKEILKLGDLLESQAAMNKEEVEGLNELDSFDIGRLYMYIMIKAKTDTDFLNWWMSYNFNISKYVYDYRNIYITIGTGTGTKKLVG